MAEHWSCIECECLFDDTDGDIDKGICNKCLDMIKKDVDKDIHNHPLGAGFAHKDHKDNG